MCNVEGCVWKRKIEGRKGRRTEGEGAKGVRRENMWMKINEDATQRTVEGWYKGGSEEGQIVGDLQYTEALFGGLRVEKD